MITLQLSRLKVIILEIIEACLIHALQVRFGSGNKEFLSAFQ